MFEVVFLGTSASIPSTERNQSGLLVSFGGTRMLVDCGEGTQRQMLRAGVGLRRPHRILFTHGHFDHVLGLPELLATLGLQQSHGPIMINGSRHTLEIVAGIIAGFWPSQCPPIALELEPLEKGQRIEVDGFAISCFPVSHRDSDSLAYIFEVAPRRHLLAERLQELGVPDGPIRSRLASGMEATLPSGLRIRPDDVLGPPEGGRKLVVVGDIESTQGIAQHVRDADMLIIEATFLDSDAAIARDYGHLTAAEGAQLAAQNGVRRLVLTHVSGRYGAGEIFAEASAIFPGAVVAADFDRFSV